MTTTIAPASSSRPLACATSTSARSKPNVWRSVGGRCAMRSAASASPSASTSEVRWAASASSARLPNSEPADELDHEERRVRDERDEQRPAAGSKRWCRCRQFTVRPGYGCPRPEPLGAGRFAAEQLLDVARASSPRSGGQPFGRDRLVDRARIDRPPLVRRLVHREARAGAPRSPSAATRSGVSPASTPSTNAAADAAERPVVRRVELGERRLAAVFFVEHERREVDVQVAAQARDPDEAARALDLEELVGAVVVAADEHVGRVRHLHHAEQVVARRTPTARRSAPRRTAGPGARPPARCARRSSTSHSAIAYLCITSSKR